MGRRNRKGRDITGIVVVDKPIGRSSNQVLQQVKRIFQAKKAGHTGSLDPLATGVLPICLGEATKVSSYLLDADKRYHVTCQLGIMTDSGDAEGNILSRAPVPEFTAENLIELLSQFLGEQSQVPPMYSALKHHGQPLYKLARQGIDIERKSRSITIYDIQLLSHSTDKFTLDVQCSKGTYIRTLVEDISQALGCGGHVIMLRRVQAAGYSEKQAFTIAMIEQMGQQGVEALDALVLPTEDALPEWPRLALTDEEVTALRHGQMISINQRFESANVRLFDPESSFIGLGEMRRDGLLLPKRVFVSQPPQ